MEFLEHLKSAYNDEVINAMKDIYNKCGLDINTIAQKSEHIVFNNGIELSIQAGYNYYCEPRMNLPYDKYTEMEFAIVQNNGLYSVPDILPKNDEYNDYYDGTVYGYVPVKKIEKLYQALKEKYGLKGESENG